MAFVLIQEGGASTELYLHSHGTLEEAEEDRVSCSKDGAYRTSEIVEVPDDLANYPGFYEAVEELLRACDTLECVKTDEGDEEQPS